jgi:hypothetical protein
MKANLSTSLALVLVGLAAFACSAEKKSTPLCENGSCDSDSEGNDKSSGKSSHGDGTLPSGSVSEEPSKSADAGADANPGPTEDCTVLNDCCLGLTDFTTQLACVAIAMAKDGQSCAKAVPECKAGGGTLGSTFQSDHPQCAALADCCKTFSDQGNSITAQDCALRAESGDDPSCETKLESYQEYGECQ